MGPGKHQSRRAGHNQRELYRPSFSTLFPKKVAPAIEDDIDSTQDKDGTMFRRRTLRVAAMGVDKISPRHPP
ncbi:hypothetical protein HETIRDRAFT_453253 [Heterobasidion irregulare TC 32-1]|uniref:Uncharacterized protein n=1 Tax=Heterobasidion irregulare (strain TC 32-1) TaxID=747525 RepID=W4JZW2_HETIT|nr:uncharacterized protein HETIRDRAFT_453253 [Heterobasidion irregulare TC 32-1]ETW78630.1 hypothetical protein HETIRDRAFT_453253 [Heterobasidion irregulare TC 32-1]